MSKRISLATKTKWAALYAGIAVALAMLSVLFGGSGLDSVGNLFVIYPALTFALSAVSSALHGLNPLVPVLVSVVFIVAAIIDFPGHFQNWWLFFTEYLIVGLLGMLLGWLINSLVNRTTPAA